MGVAVGVVVAVGLVVLVVVADQVAQREAVVGGDEVDAGHRLAAVVGERVLRAGQARGELRQRLVHAPPVVADGVAEPVVPLRPRRRELAQLVAARADVPRLGDQLDLAQHRVLLDRRRGSGVGVERRGRCGRATRPGRTGTRRRGTPCTSYRSESMTSCTACGAAQVHGVAAPGVVDAEAAVVGRQPVVGPVVDAAQAQGRAEVAALCGVVVDHVEDDLDAGLVQRLTMPLNSSSTPLRVVGAPPGRVRREPRQRVVAPVVGQPARDQLLLVTLRVDRQQLDRGDAERLEVRDRGVAGQPGERAAQLSGHVGVRGGEALDVRPRRAPSRSRARPAAGRRPSRSGRRPPRRAARTGRVSVGLGAPGPRRAARRRSRTRRRPT